MTRSSSVSMMPLAAAAALGTAVVLLGGGLIAGAGGKAPDPAPFEALPGGGATSRASVDSANAFSAPSANMPFEKELEFKLGNALFRKLWVSAPASTRTSDGLGPLFNARSCQGCHVKDGRGRPPSGNWPEDDAVSMLLRLSIPPQTPEEAVLLAEHKANVMPEPVYGGQLQNFALQGLAIEGRMHITYEEEPAALRDGTIAMLRKPSYQVQDLGFGSMHPMVMLSPRVAQPMIGLGLLEAIPEADILALADPDDADGNGISGRPNRVWSLRERRVMLGRFGWKAGNPTIEQQSAEAFAGDIGIGNPLVPRAAGDCTERQSACRAAPDGAPKSSPGIEIASDLLALVTFYAQNLAVPPRRGRNSPQVLAGRRSFHSIGCASCHVPSFRTGEAEGQPHLSRQIIWPYTDLLLHDMGEGLADNRPEGAADGREWRTPPLWGIGLTEVVSGHTFFLHDGRARSLAEAILWHGGEARSAREAFAALSKEEREALIAFVSSL